jgi:hypothetical protein
MTDVAAFDTMVLPFTAIFWRPRYDGNQALLDAVVHRNPLFSVDIGTDPVRTVALDTLHGFYYGPVMRTVSTIVWRTVLENPWAHTGTKEVTHELGFRSLRAHMMRWQVSAAVPHPRRLHELTATMVGSCGTASAAHDNLHTGCLMKTKAAENSILLDWSKTVLHDFGLSVHQESLNMIVDALIQYREILQAEGRLVTPRNQDDLMQCCRTFCAQAQIAQIHGVPKHHVFVHMTLRTASR